MSKKGGAIREYILDNIEKHPKDIAKVAAGQFGLTRQALNKHIQKLVAEGAICAKGAQTRAREYELVSQLGWSHSFTIGSPEADEDVVWRENVSPLLGTLPKNVIDIWEYCITEMTNNAIDHSGGTEFTVFVTKNAAYTSIMISDNGIGIFKKIKEAMNLLDERHAMLELAKGKLTTDPSRHTGEGVFFTSRLVDTFHIISGDVQFSHQFGREEDWVIDSDKTLTGTLVTMDLSNHAPRTSKEIFDQFSGGDDYGFIKTVIPVRLAQYGNDTLVSRSQAKRLLARVERFRVAILDFSEVDTIGQAFADEIFRVFAKAHPEVTLMPINVNQEVQNMISRAKTAQNETITTIPV